MTIDHHLPRTSSRGLRAGCFVAAAWLAAVSIPADAQWLNLPTPDLPRLPDGKVDLEAPAPRTAGGKPDFSGLWRKDNSLRYYNNVAADLAETDMAPEAHALFEQRTLEFGKDSMETLCMPQGVAYLTSPFREFRIVQTPTLIVFAYDDGRHREIFMDGRALEPDPNPSWMGYSVGRWDGDALVVDSNGYSELSWLDFGGHPHTEALRVTERYTRTALGEFELQITMTDPSLYFKPIEIEVQAVLVTDMEMLEYICTNHYESRERMSQTQAAEVVEVPAATLASYVGIYDVKTDLGDDTAEISVDGTILYLEYNEGGKEALIALSPSRFSWAGSGVAFTRSADGVMIINFDYAEGRDSGMRRQ